MISHLLSVHLEYPPKLGKHVVFRAALPSKTCYRQLDCKADEESAVIDLSKGIRSTLLSCCWQLVLTCFKATGTSFIRYMVPTDLYKNSRVFHLAPQWGAADAETKVPLKLGVSQYTAMHATLTARDFFLANLYPSGPFTCIFLKPLPNFSCVSCG